MKKLTHLNEEGQARMVNVSQKPVTQRQARARGKISFSEKTLNLIKDQALPKGDLWGVARTAAILGCKKTPELIALCHPLSIHRIEIDFQLLDSPPSIIVESFVETRDRTGVEMEALTAVSIALLNIYDMIKAVEREAEISEIVLVEKRGGVRGDYIREER